jgi:hypothetical protein
MKSRFKTSLITLIDKRGDTYLAFCLPESKKRKGKPKPYRIVPNNTTRSTLNSSNNVEEEHKHA